MKYLLLSIVLLLFPTQTYSQVMSYDALDINAEEIRELESSDKFCLLAPTGIVYQEGTVSQSKLDTALEDDLGGVNGWVPPWRRKPSPTNPDLESDFPLDPNPPRRSPIKEDPETDTRFPILKGIFGMVFNLPIIKELFDAFSYFFNIIFLLAVWGLPVYFFRWRLIWPWDIFLKLMEKVNELRRPLEDE